MNSIQQYHTLPFSQRVLWSDSTTVLAWINSNHRQYNKFVAFRIGEILSSSDIKEWRWIPSKLNVSDVATKWGKGPDINSDSVWFKGLPFLHQDEEYWPKQRPIGNTSEEKRTVHTHWEIPAVVDASRFSRWIRLHRTAAFVCRFVENLKRKKTNITLQCGTLTQEELQKAEEMLWRTAQAEFFSEEIAILQPTQGAPETHHKAISESSCIYKCWPYLDQHGVLRQRGRIAVTPFIPFEAKYPVILPSKHHITYLIVDDYHRCFKHANRETILNEINQRFQINRLRAVLQNVAKNCMHCRISKAIPRIPVMGPLPSARLNAYVKPFTSVGVDYFGPVMVRQGRSQVKRWVALFTCLTIRAVHIEIVHSLSTDSCIMAVKRFIARRGTPSEFYSDNGTCFHGTSKELQLQTKARNESLAKSFTNSKTVWKFIPPAAPHMGGAWERLVYSVKSAVGVILESPRKPDDETLETILLDAEAQINSRPLTFVALESADQEAITPNHFLLGNSSGTKSLPSADVDSSSVLRSSWKLAQHLTNEFWKRWVKEYLPIITRR